MTIMLLPGDQMLVLGDEAITLESRERIAKYLSDFLHGRPRDVAAMYGVTMVIDARVTPAIAINVPK